MTAIRGCGAAKGRHRDDRAASGQPKQAAHAKSANVNPLHTTLARRAFLRLDSMAAPDSYSLEVSRHTFSALANLPASSSSSTDFETGSRRQRLGRTGAPLR